MPVLALDFDGVIAESAREAYVVAVRTYLAMRPGSRLAASPAAEAAATPGGHAFETDDQFAAFRTLMPLGNRAEDYGVTLAILEARAEVAGQADYDAWYGAQAAAFLRDFHARFYVERARLMAEDAATWRELQPPYRPVVEMLRRHAGEATLAIATAKDRASTLTLLEAYGVADLFAEGLVLDKEAGASKRAHLSALATRLGRPVATITFVDDKLRHLVDVAPLGVRCVLAGWGYNGQREQAAAAAGGFKVATFETMDAALFGRGGRRRGRLRPAGR